MAARLSLDERVFIESSLGAGRSVADVARRLGRDPSTVHRELARCGERADYDARAAHASACARARRARTPKPARDPVLAAAVNECLRLRWSPHAAAADLRAAGMSVCAETIYLACYANDPRSGLPAGSWERLPAPRAPRPAHCEAQPARGIQAESRTTRRRRGPHAARAPRRRPHRRQGQPHRCGHARGAHQPLRGHRGAARRLRRAASRRGSGLPALHAGAHAHLGPRPRDGPLGRRRGRARHRGVLLRAALALAAAHKRAHQRAAAPMAPKRHQSRHRTTAPCGHRGQTQPHATSTPRLAISRRHLHSAHLQPPVEFAILRLRPAVCGSIQAMRRSITPPATRLARTFVGF